MILRTSRDSTVASCALTALGTFSPAACQSVSGKSAWPNREVMGTTNRSPGKVPRPMTMAGRTLWLLRSVNGMGRSTTSLREQGIEDIVGVVFPSRAQAACGLFQPCGAFGIFVHRLDGDKDMSVLGQRK